MTEKITHRQTAERAAIGAVPAGSPASTARASRRAGTETETRCDITLEKLKRLTRRRAPIVGIARVGDKPLAISGAILADLLTNLNVCHITLADDLEIRGERRHYRLRSLDMRRGSEHYKMLKAWAARERKRKASRRLAHEERQKTKLLRNIARAERKA